MDELERILWAYWQRSGLSANRLARRLREIAKDIQDAERDIAKAKKRT